MALKALEGAREVLATAEFTHDGWKRRCAPPRRRLGSSRPDVPAHPRGRVRPQERAAAV
jgi:hypothetical protein